MGVQRRRLLVVAGVALVAVSFAGADAGARGGAGRIVFVASRRVHPAELVAVRADGSGQTVLATGYDGGLVTGPGSTFAFVHGKQGADMAMVGDTRGVRPLVRGRPLAFSPDGDAVLVQNPARMFEVRDRATGALEHTFAGSEQWSYASWSSSGLLFGAVVDGRSELHAVAADGTDERVIAHDVAIDNVELSAASSHDGRWVAYAAAAPSAGNPAELIVARADGSEPRALGLLSGDVESGPWFAWSPNSARIAFIDWTSGQLAIDVADGSVEHVNALPIERKPTNRRLVARRDTLRVHRPRYRGDDFCL